MLINIYARMSTAFVEESDSEANVDNIMIHTLRG